MTNLVHCVHATEHNSLVKGDRVRCEWQLSFDDVKESELKELAAELLIIRVRPAWRKTETPDPIMEISVRSILDMTRRKIDPATKAAKAVEVLTDAQKVEVFEASIATVMANDQKEELIAKIRASMES